MMHKGCHSNLDIMHVCCIFVWLAYSSSFLSFCKFSGDSKGSVKARVVLLCIYITLLAFIITFLSGVRNSSRQYEISTVPNVEDNTVLASDMHVEPDTGPCTAVTALLHFFLLASFLWNCVYGTQLVLLLRSLHSSLPPYWTKLSHAVGWGKNFSPLAFLLQKSCCCCC